jgi:uncharacterized protein YjbJ (UPF0337 family)
MLYLLGAGIGAVALPPKKLPQTVEHCAQELSRGSSKGSRLEHVRSHSVIAPPHLPRAARVQYSGAGDASFLAEAENAMQSENIKRQGIGTAQTTLGRIWSAVGRLFGSRRMQVEGMDQEARGRANVVAGKAGEKIEGGVEQARGTVEQARGTVERNAGEVFGSEKSAAEGRARELEGKARQELNR